MGEAVDGQPVIFVEGKNVLSIIVKAINGYSAVFADDSRTTYSPSSDQLSPTISGQGVSS